MKAQLLNTALAICRHFKAAEARRGEPFAVSFKNPTQRGALTPNEVCVPVVLLKGLVEALTDPAPADESLDGRRCHDVKVQTIYWGALVSGGMPFSVRFNDRDYRLGDLLRMRDYNATTEEYTGLEVWREVTYVLATEQFCRPGFVVLGLRTIAPRVAIESRTPVPVDFNMTVTAADQYSGR